MVNVLLVGNGLHSNKRILPSLKKLEAVNSISILDRNIEIEKQVTDTIKILPYGQVSKSESFYDLGIVATPPYNHLQSYEVIVNKCRTVLIEKPLTNNLHAVRAKSIEEDLNENKLIEALMYFHHPLWEKIINIVESSNIVEIDTKFSVPHLSKDSYRYSASKGGGSLFDQGIYPISFAQQLIKSNYEINSIETNSEEGFEVDLSGKISLIIDNKINFTGSWGLGCEYNNFVNLRDSDGNIYEIDFVYSKPDLTNSKILMTKDGSNKSIEIGIHDQFQNMYLDAINKNFSVFEYSNYNNLNLRYALLEEVSETIKL
jgi:predicted dehydrogenase